MPFDPAHLAPLATVLLWSGNTIVTKAAASAIDPASIAFYRWCIALLVLTPFVARPLWRRRAIVRANWLKLAVMGTLGMATYQGLAYQAAQTASATDMGVILALMPLIAALLATALAAEPLTPTRLLGAALSLTGLVYMATQGRPASLFSGAASIGDAQMLVAVTANALYGTLLKRWPIPLTTWQQLHIQIIFGTLVILPFFLAGPHAALTAQNTPLILYAAIPASLCAPYFWITGIKHIGPARAALFMNLLPVFVALMAATLLHEQLHAYHAIGGAIALLGVALALRRPVGATPLKA